MSFKAAAFLLSSSPTGMITSNAEAALATLAEVGAKGYATTDLDAFRHAAANAVFALTVQRELCGLRSQADTVRRCAIPSDVTARVAESR